MSKTKFTEIVSLITAIIDLIRELVPIAGDALALVERISQVVKEFKEDVSDVNFLESSQN